MNKGRAESGEVPSWLLEENRAEAPRGRGQGTGFLSKTLRGIAEVFENDFFSGRYAGKPLLFQLVDPRVKFLILLSFLLLAAFSSGIATLFLLAFVAALYAGLSGLAMKDFLRRVWAYLPAVVLIFSLPGSSSLFLRGTPLLSLAGPGFWGLPDGLYFTAPGLAAALRLALRTGVSLSFGFLLLLTTGWSDLTEALAAVRVPSFFLSVLSMAYRYIYVVSALAVDMVEARMLRTVGKLRASDSRRFMGRSAAHLFLRSHYLSEEVYDAMVCRCYSGRAVPVKKHRVKGSDLLFLAGNVLLMLILIACEVLF